MADHCQLYCISYSVSSRKNKKKALIIYGLDLINLPSIPAGSESSRRHPGHWVVWNTKGSVPNGTLFPNLLNRGKGSFGMQTIWDRPRERTHESLSANERWACTLIANQDLQRAGYDTSTSDLLQDYEQGHEKLLAPIMRYNSMALK